MSRHRVSPSHFLSSSSHTTQLHYTNSYTYSHPNLNFLQYNIQILVPHVIWSAQVVRDEYRPHSTPSIRNAPNLKRVIVQLVGIWNIHNTYTYIIYTRKFALPNLHHSFRFALLFLNKKFENSTL